ncbi:MAG: hypothetical protein WCO38_09420 [Verrucomicrobiota bacterium]
MTQYTVQAPDGNTITLEGPANASQADVIAQAQKLYQPKVEAVSSQFGETGGGAAVGRPQGINRTNVLPEPRPLESALAGATKSVIDPFVGAAQLATRGNLGTSELAQKLGNEADIYAQENPVWYGAGRVTGAVAPAIATSKGIGMIPSLAKLTPYGEAAAVGAVQGALTPEETGKKDLELLKSELFNTGAGAALAAPTPVLGKIANTVYGAGKAALEPFNQQGRNLILGRALRQFSGNDAEQAIQNLRSAKELVKGSQPTVAEAAGIPSLAAVQRAAMNASPEATNALAQRQAQNVAARTNALENIATPTRIAKYQDLRTEVADELYSDALKPLNLGKLTPTMTKQVEGLVKTPAIEKAMSQAKENAANRGIDISDPAGSMRGLHETKMALDDQIARVKALAEKNGGAKSAELNSLQTAKSRLLSFMEEVSPTYKTARQNYERLSKPVEQLESIANIADKSTRATDSATYLNRFSNELEKAKKEGLLSDRQIGRLQAIKDDMMRTDFAANAGRGVGSNTMQNLAYNNMLQEVNLPNLLRRRGLAETAGNIGARVKDVAYGAANKRLTSEMAETLLDPRKAAALMKMASKQPLEAQVSPEQANIARLLFTQGGVNAINALRGKPNE